MIGDYAYVVVNEPVYEQDDEVNLPRVSAAMKRRKYRLKISGIPMSLTTIICTPLL
jgi:hypothetical protein